MIRVRPATPADRPALLRMRLELWPDYDEVGPQPLAVLVAVNDRDEGIGFAELSIRNVAEGCDTDRVAFLEGWYVDASVRRQGVGRALIKAAEEWGIAQGCTEFGSDALIDNELSLKAHLALGFEEVERIRCFKKMLR